MHIPLFVLDTSEGYKEQGLFKTKCFYKSNRHYSKFKAKGMDWQRNIFEQFVVILVLLHILYTILAQTFFFSACTVLNSVLIKHTFCFYYYFVL